MKKKSNKQQKPAKTEASGKHSKQATPSRKGNTPPGNGKNGGLRETAETIASGAKELYRKADFLDKQADALHMSAHAVHEKAANLPGPEAVVSLPDGGDIVIDDQQPGKVKPFPIVGIGASAGG